MNTATKEAVHETYVDVQKLIYKVSHQVSYIFGDQFDEVLSRSNSLFMEAYDRFDPDKGAQFSTYLYFHLRNKLLTQYTREKRFRDHLEITPETPGEECITESLLFVESVKSRLGKDARTVLELCLNTPKEVSLFLQWEGVHTVAKFLRTIRSYLLDLDWTAERIEKAITEIRTAIKNEDEA